MGIKLNCGCGGNILPKSEGWVNIDINGDIKGVDLVLDLEVEDLPYADNSVEEVILQDFLEHLSKARQIPFLREVLRVLKPTARVFIQVPHLRILALRYLGLLDEGMQHALTADQFADSIYGWSHSVAEMHKWGYDEESLYNVLVGIGFVVRSIGSDGGCNMLAWAYKPTEWVFMPIGGGLGDVFQTYISSYDDIPTTVLHTSVWLRRLRHFKSVYPNVKVRIMLTVADDARKQARQLLETNPYIDDIVDMPYTGPPGRWERTYSGAIYIKALWDYKHFEPDPAEIFLTSDDKDIIKRYTPDGGYIAVHPQARMSGRAVPSPDDYKVIIKSLVDRGWYVIILGIGDSSIYHVDHPKVINLVGKVNIRVSYTLVMNADGFVGTHSCLILGAWYKEVRSVCLVPEYHDDQETKFVDFFASDNPTTWGAKEDFNKTIIVDHGVNIESIVSWFGK